MLFVEDDLAWNLKTERITHWIFFLNVQNHIEIDSF